MSFKINNNCERKFLEELQNYFMKNRKGEEKIYFSGEFDSNQTKFEEMSNNLEIGVIAPSEKEGLVLLRLVRIIIDKNYGLLFIDLSEDWKGVSVVDYFGKSQNIKDIIKRLAQHEKHYMASFKLDEEFSAELSGYDNGRCYSKTIRTTLEYVDTWNLERVMRTILPLYK